MNCSLNQLSEWLKLMATSPRTETLSFVTILGAARKDFRRL